MKIRTKIKAGVGMNHNVKKLSGKRVRGGVAATTTVRAGQKG